MNVLDQLIINSPSGKDEICAKFSINDTTTPFVFHDIVEIGEKYAFSFYVRSDSEGSIKIFDNDYETNNSWDKKEIFFIANEENLSVLFNEIGTYYFYNTQLETGNKVTDWKPAIEDTQIQINKIETTATQTATMFNWLVEGNADDKTSLTLTSTMAELIADKLVIKDSTGSSTIISGGTMNIDEIFARDITATGTIRGVNLIGATGEFTGSVTTTNILATGGTIGGYTIGEYVLEGSNVELYSGHTGAEAYIKFLGAHISLQDNLKVSASGCASNCWSLYSTNYSETYYPSGDSSTSVGTLAYGTYGILKLGRYLGDPAYILNTKITLNGFNGTITSVGDITIDKSENGADTTRLVLMNSLREARFYVGSNGDVGLYDATNSKYLLTSPADGSQLTVNVPIVMSSSRTLTIGSGVYRQGSIELYAANPYIDFHEGSSTADYTSRIYAGGDATSGHLRLVSGRVTITGGNYAVTMGAGFDSGNVAFLPAKSQNAQPTAADATVYLGASASRWNRVYASVGTIQTSDERDKDIIGNITMEYLDVFMELSPILYRWKDFDKDIIHMGLGAQSVERTLWNHGLTIKEFGSVEHADWSNSDIVTEDGRTDRYGMNYAELSVLTMAVVQSHEKRLNTIEYSNETQETVINQLLDENALLKKRIEQLENKLSY